MHAHVEILHVQSALWRSTLNLKSRSLVFYPTQGGKNFKYHFSTLMGDPNQKPFKKIHTIIFFINQIAWTIFCPIPKKKLRFDFWCSHFRHLRQFGQISVRNEILKNSNFTNSNAKSIRLSSKPFSLPRKYFIKKPWGNFHFLRLSIYHLISRMKTSVVRLSRNHRK